MSTLSDHDHEANLRKQILELTRELQRHRQQTRKPFEPGVDYLGYAGRVYDEQEVVAAVDTVLDFWLTLGPEGAAFEKELAEYNIAVNCVTPAAAKTRIFDQISQEHIDYMLSKIPRNRFLMVDEAAAMITWMVSEENSFTTGAAFDISGGRATY